MTSRRRFLITLPATALSFAATRAQAAEPARVDESDPQATALGYRHDATKVDAKRYPTYVAGHNCANCQLFQGKPGEAWGGCGALGGRLVNAKGWCIAWAKKA
jgi:L-asparaginase II